LDATQQTMAALSAAQLGNPEKIIIIHL